MEPIRLPQVEKKKLPGWATAGNPDAALDPSEARDTSDPATPADQSLPAATSSHAAGRVFHADPADPTHQPGQAASPELQKLEARIISALRNVYDPEIPVNIYELGLIYDIQMQPNPTGDYRVLIKMTLTSPACPEAQSLPLKVESALNVLPEVSWADVEIVWDPPWSPSRMTDVARLATGLM